LQYVWAKPLKSLVFNESKIELEIDMTLLSCILSDHFFPISPQFSPIFLVRYYRPRLLKIVKKN